MKKLVLLAAVVCFALPTVAEARCVRGVGPVRRVVARVVHVVDTVRPHVLFR